ncbi:MAG: DUF4402 domain-containing protein [Alphaproteobacteria bacterium]|nr:DUF4402 domain-containing protein [Alphaproteobacteria bacterium]
MRKYFLLSAIALLATSTANADNYAEIEMTAKITEADSITCSPLNFGHIVLDNKNDGNEGNIKILFDDFEITDNGGGKRIVAVNGSSAAICDISNSSTITFPNDAKITGPNGDLTVGDFQAYYDEYTGDVYRIGATLYIPGSADTEMESLAGEYTGSFTLTVTY